MAKFNMKGWDWKKWVSANKGNLRLIIAAMFGIIAGTSWGIGAGGVITAVSKLVLDSFDYYFSE